MKNKYIMIVVLTLAISTSFLLHTKLNNTINNTDNALIAENDDTNPVRVRCSNLHYAIRGNTKEECDASKNSCYSGRYLMCQNVVGGIGYARGYCYDVYNSSTKNGRKFEVLREVTVDENKFVEFNVNLNGGNFDKSNSNTYETKCSYSGGKITFENNPKRDNATFKGYSTDECNSITDIVPSSENITACWEVKAEKPGCYSCKGLNQQLFDGGYTTGYRHIERGKIIPYNCSDKPDKSYEGTWTVKGEDYCIEKSILVRFHYANGDIIKKYPALVKNNNKVYTSWAEKEFSKEGYRVFGWSTTRNPKDEDCKIGLNTTVSPDKYQDLYACEKLTHAPKGGCYYCKDKNYKPSENGNYTSKYKYFDYKAELDSDCDDNVNLSHIKWGSEYCVDSARVLTLDANNGKFSNGSETKRVGCFTENNKCTLEEYPTWSGYKFYGWSLVDNWTGSNSPTALFDYSTADTLYAVWKENEETINAYRYASDGALYQGDNISCSDKLYISKCDNKYCIVTSINGIDTSTTTKVYKNKISTTDTINSCTNKIRYVKENAYYYYNKDAEINIVYGDINLDGIVDGKDLVRLTKYLNNEITLEQNAKKNADLNLDEIVDETDAEILRKYLAGDNSVNKLPYTRQLPKDAKEINCGSEIKLIKSLGDACQDNVCEVSINNENVFVKEDIIVTTKPTCSNTQATSNNLTGFKGTTLVQITYEKDKDELIEQSNLEEAVTCADGFNKSYYMVSDSDTCKDIESGTCSKNYQVSCIPKLKPKVSGTGSTVRSNGYGTISFSAVDVNNVGIKGYFISSGESPTVNSSWLPFENQNYSASAELLAGTYFIWVIDNNNTISYSLMVRVIDTDSSNSLSSLSVKSENGTDYTMTRTDPSNGEVAFVDKTLNYVRLSNELKSDSVLAGFESLATGYEVTVKENKIAVYATLTSADASYVEGYEPRTVDLDYGRNVILIKIMNKQGKIRTYTIIANRVDDRQSNNLISDIKLSKGKIEFDPYTSNYEVTIPKNTKEVDVGATLDSAGSKFVSGYTPGKVAINDDETSKVIKVISEAGIVRSYVITFVRSGAKLDTSINSSVYLSSLSVPGTGLEFDKETNSYTVSVGYEVQELPVNAYAESKNAKVDIVGNYNFKVGTNAIEVLVTNGSKARVYTIYVIRKQDGLTIDEDTALSTLTVKGYNIGFKPDIFDYAVKIKREKSLIITATPLSNRSEVYMYGNNDLTGFSTVRVKVIAENGNTSLYSIDIQKDAFNEKLEKILTISAVGVAIIGGVVIFIKNRKRKMKEYLGE